MSDFIIKVWKKLFSVTMVFSIALVSACSGPSSASSSTLTVSEAETKRSESAEESVSTIADNSSYIASDWDKYVQDNYSDIDSSPLELAEFQISFNKYFYDIDAGIVSCEFSIGNKDGSDLSEEQYNQLKKYQDEFYEQYRADNYEHVIRAALDIMSILGDTTLSRGSDGSVIMAVSRNLPLMVDEGNLPGENIPSRISLTYNNSTCTFPLPTTYTRENTLQFDIPSESDVLFLSLGEYEFNIVWDITESYSEFSKNDTDETGTTSESDTSEEDSDFFTPYKIIELKYKDGKSEILYSSDDPGKGNIISSANYGYDHDMARAQLWGRFTHKLDLSDVDSISIDGMEIPVAGT